MKLPSSKLILVNSVAVMIIGAAVVTQVKRLFHVPVTPHCTERYHKAVALGVERNGAMISAADIQAGAGGADFGIMENLAVARVNGAPRPIALAVTLREGGGHYEHHREPRGGIFFPWKPRALAANITAACLSFDIMLPANFDYGQGVGTLPGLSGTSAQLGADKNERFVVNFGWGNQGLARLKSIQTVERQQAAYFISSENKIPRGRWTRVDQEVVLNTPGQADGMLRLWVDERLVGELGGLTLRQSADTTIDTVLAEVHYGANPANPDGRAVKDERVMITPFEVRW